MPDEPLENEPTDPELPKGKKRHWVRKFFLFSILILIVALSAVNGPVVRYLAKQQVNKAAMKQGLQGDFTIEGTLTEGLVIYDLDYRGDGGIQRVSAARLEVDYDPLELLKKRIQGIDLREVQIVIDTAKFPDADAEDADVDRAKDEEKTGFLDVSRRIRSFIEPLNLRVEDVEITVLDNAEPSLAFQWAEFSHGSGSDSYYLYAFKAQNAARINTAPQDVVLQWADGAVAIDRWEVLPNLAVQEFLVDWSATLKGKGQVTVGQAVLEVEAEQDLKLELISGVVTTELIEETLGRDLPFMAAVNQLRLKITDWSLPVKQWDASGNAYVTESTVGRYQLRNASLTFAQKNADYALKLEGDLNGNRINGEVDGQWSNPARDRWWEDTILSYDLTVPVLGDLPKLWLKQEVALDYRETALQVSGNLTLKNRKVMAATTKGVVSNLIIQDEVFPPLSVEATLTDGKVKAQSNLATSGAETLEVMGSYDLKDKSYDAAVNVNTTTPDLLNALLRFTGQEVEVIGDAKLSWNGKGYGENGETHVGNLDVDQIRLKYKELPEISIIGDINYDYPKMVNIERLQVSEGIWEAETKLDWNGARVVMDSLSLRRSGDTVAEISGEFPYTTEVKSLEQFLEQPAPWLVDVSSSDLDVEKLRQWTGELIPPDISAIVESNISISGSPSAPKVDGFTNLSEIKGVGLSDDLELNVNFSSLRDKMEIQATGREGDANRIDVKGLIPFYPIDWLQNPQKFTEEVRNAPISAEAKVSTFPLSRITDFIPSISYMPGNVDLQGTFSGTINNPKYKMDLAVNAQEIALTKEAVGLMENVKLEATLREDKVAAVSLSAEQSGGTLKVSGSIGLADPTSPTFDLKVVGRHLLARRDDLLSIRGNADLQISGNLQQALVSGDLGVVESIVYKDIELIPIGVPSSSVAAVELPQFSATDSDKLPIPEPFASWKVDVGVSTVDPILIRGNFARGKVEGKMQLRGTMKNPQPDGKFFLRDVRASLPFSKLNVKQGEITFKPARGIMNPELRIPGESRISGYNVNILVYGSAYNPQTSLTSSPPLPESEVMSLLGTGATTSSLQNQNTVALRAAQLLLIKLRDQRFIPGGNRLFSALLAGIDDLNLQVGQDDVFTGREFTSATLEVDDNWFFTTQIDEEQDARALLIYQIRFK